MKTREESFLDPRAVGIASVVFVVMLGVVDWASGYELQVFVFYFLPIAVAAWGSGRRFGYLVAVISATVWLTADACSGHPYAHFSFAVWNTVIRLISFLTLAFAVTRIRELLSKEREVSDQLERTLSEVKTLTGLLPICASCKKIRNDAGYWQQIEEYIEKHTSAQFTHALCHTCAAKLLKEAGIAPDEIDQSLGEDSSTHSDVGRGTAS